MAKATGAKQFASISILGPQVTLEWRDGTKGLRAQGTTVASMTRSDAEVVLLTQKPLKDFPVAAMVKRGISHSALCNSRTMAASLAVAPSGALVEHLGCQWQKPEDQVETLDTVNGKKVTTLDPLTAPGLKGLLKEIRLLHGDTIAGFMVEGDKLSVYMDGRTANGQKCLHESVRTLPTTPVGPQWQIGTTCETKDYFTGKLDLTSLSAEKILLSHGMVRGANDLEPGEIDFWIVASEGQGTLLSLSAHGEPYSMWL